MTFVLQMGNYTIAKMEYSYARRAQSVTHTFNWKDVAVLNTDSIEEAKAKSLEAIADWVKQGFTAERWQLEGRGAVIGQYLEINRGELNCPQMQETLQLRLF